MSKLRAFGAFWYDFVIGDDWLVAVGVVIGLAVTYGLDKAGVTAWWVLPLLLVILLPLSLQRAVSAPLLPRRKRGQRTPPASPHIPPAN
jgi:phage shock protein PspC (stress-responsive transcriptional regulator)